MNWSHSIWEETQLLFDAVEFRNHRTDETGVPSPNSEGRSVVVREEEEKSKNKPDSHLKMRKLTQRRFSFQQASSWFLFLNLCFNGDGNPINVLFTALVTSTPFDVTSLTNLFSYRCTN